LIPYGSAVKTVRVLGIPFSVLTLPQTEQWLVAEAEAGRPRRVVTANPETVMLARREKSLWQAVQTADLVTPDGIGIVVAAKLRRTWIPERVTGADLSERLMARGNERRWRVYILGAAPAANQDALHRLGRRYPQLELRGRDGYFHEEEIPEIVRDIAAFQPHLLFVGLGAPRQDVWLHRYFPDCGALVGMGVGGMVDVWAGHVRRAPPRWQRWHLEWLYRLIRQPGRIRRQWILPVFVAAVFTEGIGSFLSKKRT
jgi:N-acetylglucosaminyldiphosphoundecaprenol N-acetyl-beta-D-mannosaminyltransferase